MTGDLVAFLRARLEDEAQAARAAADGGSGAWFVRGDWEVCRSEPINIPGMPPYHKAMVPGMVPAQLHHIAHHDPARVLDEVDAKRRILEQHHRSGVTCPRCSLGTEDGEVVFERDPCETLRALALPYADHPDHQPEWAPEE